MSLTPVERHRWFLIEQHLRDTRAICDPVTEDRNTLAWTRILSAGYVLIGAVTFLLATLGVFSPFTGLLGLLVSIAGCALLYRAARSPMPEWPDGPPSRFFD